ncbi:hypothetical protein ABPG74_000209 [Tetrahymena malaccensis]
MKLNLKTFILSNQHNLIEQRINKWLDDQNIQIVDPSQKTFDYFQSKKLKVSQDQSLNKNNQNQSSLACSSQNSPQSLFSYEYQRISKSFCAFEINYQSQMNSQLCKQKTKSLQLHLVESNLNKRRKQLKKKEFVF